jgi:hypothetical protein
MGFSEVAVRTELLLLDLRNEGGAAAAAAGNEAGYPDEDTVHDFLHQRFRSTIPRSPSRYPHSDPRVHTLTCHSHSSRSHFAHSPLTSDPHAQTLTLTISAALHPAAPAAKATSSSAKPHRSDSQRSARLHQSDLNKTLEHPSGWPPPFEPSEPTAPARYRFRWSVLAVLPNAQRGHH